MVKARTFKVKHFLESSFLAGIDFQETFCINNQSLV